MSESQSQRLKTIRTFSKRTQAGMNATFLANNVQVQQSAQSEALAGDARISAISKKLTAFKSTHKKIFVKTEHQFDWRREFSNLKDAENKAGKVTSAALVSLLEVINTQKRLGDYKTDGEVVGDVEILIADQNIIVTNKVPSSVTNVYKSKLAELRTILGELKEGKTNTNAANANGEAQKYATSLFAELLLRCHEQLSSEEQLLEKELEECLVEEKQTRLAVMKSLRGYNEEEDGNEEEELPAVLTNQFTEGGFEEHIEVQLLREELRAKFVEAKRKNETEYSIENKYTEANNSSDKQLFTDSDSTTFTKIIKDWERTSKKGGLKKVTERMKLELPHKSSGEISANIDAYNRRNFETTHKKNADVNLKRVLAQLTEFGIKRINAVKEGIKVNITQEIIGKINATMRQEQQARLTVLRAAREEARRIEEEKEKKLREELKEKEDEEAKKLQAEQDETRAVVDSYKAQLEREKLAEIERLGAVGKMEEEERKERMEENRERIEFRFILNQEKVRAAEHEAGLKALGDAERMERLSALAASCPYWESVMNAKADLSKNTVCRENDIYEVDGRGLHDFQGKNLSCFSNEKVFSDVRFRLGAALHAAGISGSVASRDLVRQVIPREMHQTTRIHVPH